MSYSVVIYCPSTKPLLLYSLTNKRVNGKYLGSQCFTRLIFCYPHIVHCVPAQYVFTGLKCETAASTFYLQNRKQWNTASPCNDASHRSFDCYLRNHPVPPSDICYCTLSVTFGNKKGCVQHLSPQLCGPDVFPSMRNWSLSWNSVAWPQL